ncbi:MAG: glycosyltransferase family 2 protein [Hyphomonas sp.]
MAAPKVSIVMPAYKSADFIGLAIASVRAQTLQDWELIIVDDCSPDDTAAAAMKAAGGDPRIKLVRAEQNGGVARARNLGNSHATGEWIAVLDSDDAFEPARLETLVAAGEKAGLDLVADDMLLVPFEDLFGGGAAYLGHGAETLSGLDLAAWLDGNRAGIRTPVLGYLKPMVRRAFLLRQNVAYLPELRVAEDCWFVADLLASGARFGLHPAPLYRYAIRPASLSRTRGDNVYKLQRSVYAPFLTRHDGRLSESALRALRRHEAALKTAEAFEGFAIAMRARDFPRALGWLAARPQAALQLTQPIGARLERLAKRLGYRPRLRVG